MNMTRPGCPRWPLLLWFSHLIVPVGLLVYGYLRRLYIPTGDWISIVLGIAAAWILIVFGLALRSECRRRLVEARFKLLFCIIFSLGLFVIAAEAGLRVLSQHDVDGNITFRGHRLKPYRLPVKRVRASIDTYLNAAEMTTVVADSRLGWTNRPHGRNDYIVVNGAGIRVGNDKPEYAAQPENHTYRISLFGDSFTFGDEVQYEETWGHFLSQALNDAGLKTEVLNFGIRAYGIDQAYLRWKEVGRKYSPHIVVLGLQLENMKRNVNILRPLYHVHDAYPFSKPRFVMDGPRLRLINSPCLPLEMVPHVLENIDQWDLLPYEESYNSKDYQHRLIYGIRLASLAAYLIEDLLEARNSIDPDRAELAQRILGPFAESVTSTGARFVLAFFPTKGELMRSMNSRDGTQHGAFVKKVAQSFDLVSTETALLERAKRDSLGALFEPGGHYSPLANRVVGDALSFELQERLQ